MQFVGRIMSGELLSAVPHLTSLRHLALTDHVDAPKPENHRQLPTYYDHLDAILQCPKLRSMDFSHTDIGFEVVSPLQGTIALSSM